MNMFYMPSSPSQTTSLESQTNHQQERIAQIRLARTKGLRKGMFENLMGLYRSAERALEALPQHIKPNNPPLKIPTQTEIEDEISQLEKQKTFHVLLSDPNYPLLLSHIPDPPPLLYVKGNISKLSRPSIGIVGGRNSSIAGHKIAENLSTELAHAGIIVVSGLANGIDSFAHRGAVSQGMTVAALAGGIEHYFPAANADLQEQIAETGCLLTESPPGTVPLSGHFPRRNRLIAGLSLGCVIIEAALKSGSLITANLVTAYDRMLFVVPGNPLDSRSRGGNQLLREGAILVESAQQDILPILPEELPHRQVAPWIRPRSDIDTLFKKTEPQSLSESPSDSSSQRQIQKQNKKNSKKNISPLKNSSQDNSPSSEIEKPPLKQQKHTYPEIKFSEANPRQLILSFLSPHPITVDAIATRCHLSVPAIINILVELELNGAIKSVAGGGYVLLSPIEENNANAS